MYFSDKNNKLHEEHYHSLLDHFDAVGDPEFAAACYIVAVPDVFEAIPEGKIGSNPFTWYWGPYDQVLDRRGESAIVEKLPAGLKELVRAGVEMFAGRHLHFELPRAVTVWEEDEVKLFHQAVELRTNKGR